MLRVLSLCTAALAATALSTGAVAQSATPAAPAAPAKPAAAAPAKDAPASGNVAVVNGHPIKAAELELVIRQINQKDTPELRAALRDKLIEFDLLMQEAKKQKIADREDVKFQADNAARNVIIGALLREELEKHKITDEQLHAEYDRQKSMAGEKEYKAHHILVDTEDQAKAIIAKLDKGEKFEDLAKGTKDAGSAANGGDLDWAPPGAYVKEFSEAMVKLDKGKYTETPVKSQFGYHVIRLDDVRAMQPPPFDQVKQRISDSLQQQQVKEYVEGLRKKATIK
jgi:peptidyl-prolyl cis-trans isomerase C